MKNGVKIGSRLLCVVVMIIILLPATSYGGVKEYFRRRVSAVVKKMVRSESKAAANKAKQDVAKDVSVTQLAVARAATKELKTNVVNVVTSQLDCSTNQVGPKTRVECK